MRPTRDKHEWPEVLAVYDIESDNWDQLVCVCHVDDAGQRKIFWSREEYIDWLFSPYYHFEGTVVFAHWGGRFDALFLLAEFHKRKYGVNVVMSGGQAIIIKVTNGEGRQITFADSSRLLPDSVAKIGQSVGLEKIDFDVTKIRDASEEEIEKYCFRDCEIIIKALTQLRDTLVEDGFDYAPTLASIVTRKVRKSQHIKWDRLLRRNPETKRLEMSGIDAAADKWCEHACAGGMTQVFAVGHEKDVKLYLYDISSAYPWAMLHDLPLYFKEFRPGPEYKEKLDPWFKDKTDTSELPLYRWPENHRDLGRVLSTCGVSHAWLRIPNDVLKYPLLFARIAGKLQFPVGVFEGVWTNLELLELYQHLKHEPGFRMIVTAQAVYEGRPFMRPLVEAIWARRQDALNTCTKCGNHKDLHTADGPCVFEFDEFKGYCFKIAGNSASGKLIEQPEKTKVLMGGEAARVRRMRREVLDAQALKVRRREMMKGYAVRGVPPRERKYVLPNELRKCGIPGVFILSEEVQGPFRHAAASAYVTGMTRIKLWQAFLLAERLGAKVYYCDTDSIIVDKPIFGDNQTKVLGEWNLEAVITEIEIWAPKVYRYVTADGKTVYKAKGMPIRRRDDSDSTAAERWEQYVSPIKGTRLPKPAKEGLSGLLQMLEHRDNKAAGVLEPKRQELLRQLQRTDTKRVHARGDSQPRYFVGVKEYDYSVPSTRTG